MELEEEKTKVILLRIIELNKEKQAISYQIVELLNKLAFTASQIGELQAGLRDEPPNDN